MTRDAGSAAGEVVGRRGGRVGASCHGAWQNRDNEHMRPTRPMGRSALWGRQAGTIDHAVSCPRDIPLPDAHSGWRWRGVKGGVGG